jgi:hypothetical protein
VTCAPIRWIECWRAATQGIVLSGGPSKKPPGAVTTRDRLDEPSRGSSTPRWPTPPRGRRCLRGAAAGAHRGRDGRLPHTYAQVIALRAVMSQDAMTADWARLPYDLLGKISTQDGGP